MPYTQLNNLEFDQIKTALREYMRAQSEFTDYDFEGSALSNLLDVLAYNTYYTAFNTNMVVNELFIDSATLRDNVVALAKQLGYTPKSITSPRAALSFDVDFGTAVTPPEFVYLRAGTGFITNYDDTVYQFVVQEDTRSEVSNGVASFDEVDVVEGTYVKTRTVVDATQTSQRFLIDNPSVDLSTLKVKVYQSNNTSVNDEYQRVDNILDPSVSSATKGYFVSCLLYTSDAADE